MSQDHNHLNLRHGSDARPRAHTDLDPAEIFGFGGDRYLKGKSSIWIAQNVERKLGNFLATNSGRGVTSFRPSGGTKR
jgi:hypothetical protein